MARVIVLLFVALALAAVAESSPISDIKEVPTPGEESEDGKAHIRPKRCLDCLFNIVGMVERAVAEMFNYDWEPEPYYKRDAGRSIYIGNGHHNINNVDIHNHYHQGKKNTYDYYDYYG